jgi:RHS repeat-associated protein
VATLRPNGSSIAVYYVHSDQLGAPRRISRPSDNIVVWQWDSDPFGTTAPSEDPDGDGIAFIFNLRFPGQYYDAETGLNYNMARDFDPLTGRYIESDPIGLAGGVNTYAYAYASPLQWSDPSGLDPRQLDPNSEECKALARKIDNIRKDIDKRKREYEENPGKLPESVPGGKPRESREGHLGLIKDLEQILAQREREYAQKCGGQQCPDDSAIKNIAGALGISVTTYLIISEGSRLFPPRNLIPIP